jgi:histidyl-tRNA synthetase
MRILDCKSPVCHEIAADAPVMLQYLCDDCAAHFEAVKGCLEAANIPYVVDEHIVRGLDYYTRTVFELVADNGLVVAGGGRYDGLIKELGGQPQPGLGFGMGIERMIMVQDLMNAAPQAPAIYDAFVVTMGDDARIEGVKLVNELREAGVKADLDHAARSMKAQFKYADKLGAQKVVILAGDELEKGIVTAVAHKE